MSRYSVGIDLGTTHCAVSWFELTREEGRGREQTVLPIPQLTAPGVVEERDLLPSFLYLPGPEEFAAGSLALPWDRKRDVAVGELARSHGSKVPHRLVSSAKSWLCHAGVDRKAPLLPWQAPSEERHVSAVAASQEYLRHLKEAWNHKFGAEERMEEQEIVLTVPASFDAAARELTLEAAEAAGLRQVTLLEEPQAALYAWLESMSEGFRKQVSPGEVILVVDVGGGTTDFSLIAVVDRDGELGLERLAVGDHILLGGDNMDLALSHTLAQRLNEQGKKLDGWQFNVLTHGCRIAKEHLFGNSRLKKAPISIPSRGSALIGGTIKTELEREDLERILVEGFFPRTKAGDFPQVGRRMGLAQIGLPYAQDAAVSRHLAAFLGRQAKALGGGEGRQGIRLKGKELVHPTTILFNGGVFKAGILKERLLEVVNRWLAEEKGEPVRELEGADLDLSVARGAAYYGWVRKGHGLRIRGGTARSYYVGVELAAPAVPGFEPPVKALCVAPFGMEEGTAAEVPPQEFGLVVGESTRFRFFASSVRREDKVGDAVEPADGRDDLEEVSPIETTLPVQAGQAGRLIPVRLQAALTEVGTLELRCLEKDGAGKWKLELNVRMKE